MNKQQSKVRYSIRKVSIGILSISIGMFWHWVCRTKHMQMKLINLKILQEGMSKMYSRNQS